MLPKPPAVKVTTDYSKFHRSGEGGQNRLLNLEKHTKLRHSFEKYGCLSWWPIVVWESDDGKLDPADGQHRLAYCEQMGLPVYYIVAERDFDIAEINNTQKVWQTIDYAELYAHKGKKPYVEALAFWEQYKHIGVTLAMAAALLGGYVSFSPVEPAFKSGLFVVKEREWAERVMALYAPIVALSRGMRNNRFLEACMAVCRIEEFDASRLLQGARRDRGKLIGYSKRDDFLTVMEEVYNYGRQKHFGLKSAALNALKDRNAVSIKKKAKAERLKAAAHASGNGVK